MPTPIDIGTFQNGNFIAPPTTATWHDMGTRPPAIIIKTTVTERHKLNDRFYDYITMLLSIHVDDSLQLY